MKARPRRSAGWIPAAHEPLWIYAVAAASLGLGAIAGVISTDLGGWTRSPFCGPSCLDAPIEKALLSEPDEIGVTYIAARRAAMKQLEISPFDTSAWLRMTLLEIKVGGGMTPSAQSALMSSYERAPVDASVAEWRIPLVFGYWREVGPELREAAIKEVKVLYASPQNRRRLHALTREIKDTNGAFAYWLLLERL